MTRAEKFEEVFGLKIDTDNDCAFFDCSGTTCSGCYFNPSKINKDLGMTRRKLFKKWWNEEYEEVKK